MNRELLSGEEKKLFNWVKINDFNQLMENDASKLSSLAEELIQNIETHLSVIIENYQKLNYQRCKEEIHALNGMLTFFGSAKLAQSLTELHSALSEDPEKNDITGLLANTLETKQLTIAATKKLYDLK